MLQLLVALGAIAAAKVEMRFDRSIADGLLVVCIGRGSLHTLVCLVVLRQSLGDAVLRLTQPAALELHHYARLRGVLPEGVAQRVLVGSVVSVAHLVAVATAGPVVRALSAVVVGALHQGTVVILAHKPAKKTTRVAVVQYRLRASTEGGGGRGGKAA